MCLGAFRPEPRKMKGELSALHTPDTFLELTGPTLGLVAGGEASEFIRLAVSADPRAPQNPPRRSSGRQAHRGDTVYDTPPQPACLGPGTHTCAGSLWAGTLPVSLVSDV